MRILHVITRFDYGGAENHVRELCNELASLNHKVFLMTQTGRQKELLDERVSFIRVSRWISNLLIPQVALIIYIVLRNRIDIIHAHQRLPIISACLAGFIWRVPVVATVHGRVRHDLRSAIARRLTSKILFVSNQVLSISRHYGSIRHKSVVIPNGIQIPEKVPTIEPFTIGYFSRIDARHLDVIRCLVLAVERLKTDYPNIKLIIFGDGKEFQKLKELLSEANLKLSDEVMQLRGYVNYQETWSEFPELVLGVGRVAIEALTRGASIISVNYKRMGDIITLDNYEEYSKNNFVNITGVPPTPDLVYSQLKLYFEKRDAFRTQAKNLAPRVQSDFSITSTTKMVVNTYSGVLNRSS